MPRCKLVDCTIAKDGRCLEGQKDGCPNLLPEDASENVESASSPAVETTVVTPQPYTAMEMLYSGRPLEIVEARDLSMRARATVVALAGMIESGKTSLLARLHQQFQAGPVAGYDFAGSRTLPHFEELNWKATIESGSGKPMMDHTSLTYNNSLLHIAVREVGNAAESIDVLLNDISGDTFPEAITNESVCETLLCLRRADHVAVLVDGAALADRGRRHDHCAKAKNFVQRVLQTGQIGKQTVLHLVITKRDELLKEGHEESLEAATRLEGEFTSKFTSRVAKLYTWRLAAQPHDRSMPTYEIIADLFGTWVGSTHRYTALSGPESVTMADCRDFCRFDA